MLMERMGFLLQLANMSNEEINKFLLENGKKKELEMHAPYFIRDDSDPLVKIKS